MEIKFIPPNKYDHINSGFILEFIPSPINKATYFPFDNDSIEFMYMLITYQNVIASGRELILSRFIVYYVLKYEQQLLVEISRLRALEI